MKVTDAISLIAPGLLNPKPNEIWADLGCGSGNFTKALAALLGPDGKIYAIDKDPQTIIVDKNQAQLQFILLDFIHNDLPVSNLDGILMANALHYVKDKPVFLENVKRYLKHEGKMIIVEYDTDQSNQWIPYPLGFETFRQTFAKLGFKHMHKVGERPSIYRSGKMYAAIAER